jgi:hypothetical protein
MPSAPENYPLASGFSEKRRNENRIDMITIHFSKKHIVSPARGGTNE